MFVYLQQEKSLAVGLCVVETDTHLRQRPNGPELRLCLRSAEWVSVTQLMRQVNRHTKLAKQLRVSCPLTHWGQTFTARHLLLSGADVSAKAAENLTLTDIKHLELSPVITECQRCVIHHKY